MLDHDEVSVLRRHTRWRVFRSIMYALLTVTGAIVTFYPSPLVIDQVGQFVAVIWGVLLTVSAFGAFLGSIGDRWIGEYVFLPLLWSSLALYGCSALKGSTTPLSTLFAFGLLIMGFSSGLIARWQDVRDVKKSADRSNHEE